MNTILAELVHGVELRVGGKWWSRYGLVVDHLARMNEVETLKEASMRVQPISPK